jgi:hypothetical protein
MGNEPMIIFPLMGKWYDQIVARLKTSEFRACKPYWDVRLRKVYQALQENKEPIIAFQRGYFSKTRVFAKVTSIEVVNGLDTDLKCDEDVYKIDFILSE